MKNTTLALCAFALLLGGTPRGGVAMDLQLKGKTALVTGSTAGIGYATAKALLQEGAQVIINARTQESVDKALASLKATTGRTPLSFVGDMSKAEDATRLARHYLPGMKQRNWGRIIFISSESALQIPVESIHYGMSKAAQIAVARGLAESVAKTGVTVNSVLPGPTRDLDDPRAAEMAKRFGAKSVEEMEEQFFKTRRPTSLIQRFAHPDEVASLIVYVASPLSSATTGAALRVDGGVVKSAF